MWLTLQSLFIYINKILLYFIKECNYIILLFLIFYNYCKIKICVINKFNIIIYKIIF